MRNLCLFGRIMLQFQWAACHLGYWITPPRNEAFSHVIERHVNEFPWTIVFYISVAIN